MKDEYDCIMAFGLALGGLLVAAVFFIVFLTTQPEIKHEELYRFCLIKDIPLEECIIPDKPYKKEH